MTTLKTPGVYIKEQNAFSSSVVAVPTAIPVFIGYTQKKDKDTNLSAVRISTFVEFLALFGGAPKHKFRINKNMELEAQGTRYFLYDTMRLYYANGGGACYIISLGDYSEKVSAAKMKSAIQLLLTEPEPTMLVVPDAVSLEANECFSLYQEMLLHCAKTQSRVALFDVPGADTPTHDTRKVVNQFREGIGVNSLAYGVAYYPWLRTTVTPFDKLDYTNITNRDELALILAGIDESVSTVSDAPSTENTDAPAIEGADLTKKKEKPVVSGKGKDAKTLLEDAKRRSDEKRAAVLGIIVEMMESTGDNVNKGVHEILLSTAPQYKAVLKNIQDTVNVLPPSAALAGIYCYVDSTSGVHKAPANVSVGTSIAPIVNINSEQQEDLNMPLNGKAVNAIRSFPGKGVLVWGARTLDGNSQDWKYISVRRTLIMIEQSVKKGVESYVFEANTARTWLKVKTAIENFLADTWRKGSLAGASTTEAFEVSVGLGSTMTPEDILEGVMRVSVKVAITRPAEFIEITFQQKMQES